MRSYGQYCGLAKALDVVGDRWSLLIVRELLTLGPSRYTDLRRGLPGIATNLLADRLRELEQAGIIEREEAPPPVATTLFRLTARGEALEPVLEALGRWAGPLMGTLGARDVYRSNWLALPVRLYLTDRQPNRRPVTIQVRSGDQPMLVETVDGRVRARPGTVARPDAVLTGTPDLVMGVLSGRLGLSAARAHGLSFQGDFEAVRRLQPR
jgi:DNA-binding HxlR family transcriptional regulator